MAFLKNAANFVRQNSGGILGRLKGRIFKEGAGRIGAGTASTKPSGESRGNLGGMLKNVATLMANRQRKKGGMTGRVFEMHAQRLRMKQQNADRDAR